MHNTEKFIVEQKERIVIESFTATNIAELCNRYTMPSAQFHRWKEQYEIVNNESSWTEFMERYICMKTEISLDVSTSGKYVAGKLRNMGFFIHMADPSKLPLIFNTEKKNDREDSYKLAKLLRLGELSEVYLPSKYSDDLRSLVRYRRSLEKA